LPRMSKMKSIYTDISSHFATHSADAFPGVARASKLFCSTKPAAMELRKPLSWPGG